ncbi:hypothetical protein [Janthinobacterium sp.]|uniref:hypothetical protein n=1 Tax=Janthinobacterium sp. TaxID=1871054 RepID=UPI00293D7655|nr:hypothetical protein [Janthinobacterium sp.]
MDEQEMLLFFLLLFLDNPRPGKLGPIVYVQPPAGRVDTPDSGCNGAEPNFDLAAGIIRASGVSKGEKSLPALNIKPKKLQNLATCAAVCTTVPNWVKASDSNVDILWNPLGGKPDEVHPYAKAAYNRTDAGLGYHRVYSGVTSGAWGENNLVCKFVQNWAYPGPARSFRLRVNY